ncbi:hypothetical protein CD149_10050 [Staphylococcus condimenti]|uniref:Uncharacterized protein n=1 Tax=Staphylococcus condimenti TaxID=70255 RepID=A0AB37H372_9STAP|nr:hypothetical protein [Staphylococcus condimenti]AMY06104.1 hypothetical protein A4G25_09280 [Staphylococcus condimenti]PNZ58630.1 hypothetical protein CD149_10050 [Staphylococcus condimenti]QQS82097.1 hypothetical protein I6J05_09220 [Staphylococcus condimenti]QRP95543.1 hypothetical protein I6J35_13070 [Staphylococcus condimenti]VEG63269.1 Uncharacterised protein [Staphylococcus condimenti]
MNVKVTDLLKKRLNKLNKNFKHFGDDLAYLTLTSRNDGTLKDLLGIQLLRNSDSETVAREIARLDLAILNNNELNNIIKLKSVYVQDFEQNPTVEESNAVKAIKRDIEDNLNKIVNPPKSWTYTVAEDAKLHFAAIYVDVQAKKKFELPETKTEFLKLYPELKEGDLVYKSIFRHREARDYSIEEIIEPRLQSAVFNPILDNNSDIYIKKGDIEELYKGKYKDFKVQVYLQTYEVGQGPEPEDVEIDEDVIETVDFEPDEVEATIEVDEIVKDSKSKKSKSDEKKETKKADKKSKKKKSKSDKSGSKKGNKKKDSKKKNKN